jgi:hypothetical protein
MAVTTYRDIIEEAQEEIKEEKEPIFSYDTGYLYIDSEYSGNSNNWNIAVDSGNNDVSALSFMYKGKWHNVDEIMDKLERMEKFIHAFMKTYGDQYIGNCQKFKDVFDWEKQEKIELPEEMIKDEDLEIDI